MFGLRRALLFAPVRRCSFTMAEDFTGPLAPLIIRSLPDFQGSFDQFAAALKTDSEA